MEYLVSDEENEFLFICNCIKDLKVSFFILTLKIEIVLINYYVPNQGN